MGKGVENPGKTSRRGKNCLDGCADQEEKITTNTERDVGARRGGGRCAYEPQYLKQKRKEQNSLVQMFGGLTGRGEKK